ncbi:hypothetical protein [Rhizobium sp. SU303]|uniref:hypothetical protein n=1 Tax=Rhizobium sp. SU303 TaxID=3138065 RepID=UPI001E384E0A|nr:hypothetical protein [Rhizobium leguminosarum]UFW82091.1 hypothetical protein RlegSU303_29770 [Rhizobium leguminosarum bv. viciae]
MGYEIDFLSVGDSNGDAICIRYGTPGLGYNIHITDGGYADTGQRIIDHVNQYYGRGARIANVVLSHQDGDHIAGLIPVVRHFDVGAVWMNRPWLYAAEILHAFHSNCTIGGLRKAIRDAYPLLVELEEAALAKGIPVYESFAGSWIGSFDLEEIADLLRLPDHGGLSLREISKRLTANDRVVRRLVDLGHLASEIAINPVKRCEQQIVREEALADFVREFVSLYVLAKERRENIGAVKRVLTHLGIDPAFPPEDVGARFYRRRDVSVI